MQGQTPKTLKSNISKTERDREKVSMEVMIAEDPVCGSFVMVKMIFDLSVTSKGQRSRSNPKNFEVEYLENGTR